MNRRRVLTTLRFVERIPEVFRCWTLAEDSWKLIAGYVGLSRFPLPVDVRLRNGVQYWLEEVGDASKEDLLRHLLSCGFTQIDRTGAEDYGKYYLARTSLIS